MDNMAGKKRMAFADKSGDVKTEIITNFELLYWESTSKECKDVHSHFLELKRCYLIYFAWFVNCTWKFLIHF